MDKKFLVGFDVGGTKCAVILGAAGTDGELGFLERGVFPTAEFREPERCIEEMTRLADGMLARHELTNDRLHGLGVSCGGPLDSRAGVIQSPPNLPGWDEVPIVSMLENRFRRPVRLQNDANAGAVAEWKFGAGQGVESMAFLTFGTGLGAGLILNKRLYAGCCDLAGECGHIRLAPFGPAGFGKAGSFEGFCSGGGLAQLAAIRVREQLQRGIPVEWCPTAADLCAVTAKTVADAADGGDDLAIAIYRECGEWLGRGLAVLVDLLNPELIVIGSIFARSEALLRPAMEETLRGEALPAAVERCRIVPAQLGEKIGDYAALSLAMGEY